MFSSVYTFLSLKAHIDSYNHQHNHEQFHCPPQISSCCLFVVKSPIFLSYFMINPIYQTALHLLSCFFPFLFIYLFIFYISLRLITLQYCSGFCQTLTWISHGYTCIPHPDPPSLSTRSLWVFPLHLVQALVSCIQPGLVICFTLDNIHCHVYSCMCSSLS